MIDKKLKLSEHFTLGELIKTKKLKAPLWVVGEVAKAME